MSTIYVQDPVGSRNSAIHNAYRTSLRPSSVFKPRHPSLKIVSFSCKVQLAELMLKFVQHIVAMGTNRNVYYRV